jgi:hypothetical protein
MKKVLFYLAFAAVSVSLPSYASDVGFNLGINIGNRPNVVVAAPTPPAPAYAPPVENDDPPVEIDDPPEFISPPQLGFYVAVGVPYDLYFVANQYYLCRGNVWYAAPRYNGPWAPVHYRALPHSLRRYPTKKIRYYRDAGFRHYRAGGDRYWAKHHFHPEKVMKEHRRVEKHEMKEYREAEKHEMKEYRKAERNDLKRDRREAREERNYDRHHGRD